MDDDDVGALVTDVDHRDRALGPSLHQRWRALDDPDRRTTAGEHTARLEAAAARHVDHGLIADSLADVLVKVLPADFVHVRLKGPLGQAARVISRSGPGPGAEERARALAGALAPYLDEDPTVAFVIPRVAARVVKELHGADEHQVLAAVEEITLR